MFFWGRLLSVGFVDQLLSTSLKLGRKSIFVIMSHDCSSRKDYSLELPHVNLKPLKIEQQCQPRLVCCGIIWKPSSKLSVKPKRTTSYNAVKCNLTKLTTKRSWYLSSSQRSAVGRAGSVPPGVVVCFIVAYRSGFCSWAWSYPAGFLLPSPLPFPFSTVYLSVTGAWMTACGGSWLGCGDCQPWERFTLGAGWSQWRPPDILGTYLPYSLMQ